MGFIIFALVIVAAVGGFTVGRITRLPPELKVDQVALTKYRSLVDRLYDQAADHRALGDSFAEIAFDEIQKTRKDLAGGAAAKQ